MGKRIAAAAPAEVEVSFGERLAGLRKAAGFTQIELATELGVSQRRVAYCESPAATPPADLLPQIATALGVTIAAAVAARADSIDTGDKHLLRIHAIGASTSSPRG